MMVVLAGWFDQAKNITIIMINMNALKRSCLVYYSLKDGALKRTISLPLFELKLLLNMSAVMETLSIRIGTGFTFGRMQLESLLEVGAKNCIDCPLREAGLGP